MCAFLKNSILWEYRREISYLELCFWRPLARFLVTGQKSPVPYHTFNDIYLSLAGNIKLWLLHGLTKICLHLSQNDLFYVSANKTCKAYEVLARNLCAKIVPASFLMLQLKIRRGSAHCTHVKWVIMLWLNFPTAKCFHLKRDQKGGHDAPSSEANTHEIQWVLSHKKNGDPHL